MTGNASNADDGDEPELVDDEDDGERAESTVAMASPSFDPSASGMPPSPITNPPPAFTPPSAAQRAALLQMPPTAPVPFVPGAFPPPPARPPPIPNPPPPSGGFSPIAPNVMAGRPSATGANAPPVGGNPRSRPQTVVGLAPPPPTAIAAHAQHVAAGRANMPSPPSPRPLPPRIGSPLQRPPNALARTVAASDEPDSHKEDAPTMAGSTEEALALFGLDDAAGDAASAAIRPGMPALPNQKRPAPGYADPPSIEGQEEESTRAVPREELLRAQQAAGLGENSHVIVGDDDPAAGEDATLAVAPGNNEANSKHLAALAETMTRDEGHPHQQQQHQHQQHQQHPPGFPAPLPPGFPPPLRSSDPNMQGAPYPQHGQQQQQPYFDPNQQQHQQQHQHQQQPPSSWNGPAGPGMHGGMGQQPGPISSNMQVGPPSYPHVPTNMNPGMPMQGYGQQQGLPMHGIHQQQQQQGQAPLSYPGNQQNPIYPRGASPTVGKKIKLSGQIIVLGVVGVICLAIFITGIVLFATTKF